MKKFILLIIVAFIAYKYITGEKGTQAIQGAYIIEGINITSKARGKVRNYYNMSETLPESASDIGAGRPDSYIGESLIRMEISDGGVMTLTFDKKSGIEGGKITYTPSIKNAHFSWICTTYDYKNISLILPECSYKEYPKATK